MRYEKAEKDLGPKVFVTEISNFKGILPITFKIFSKPVL